MVEKGIFPKAVILLFGILTFVSSAAYATEPLAPQSFIAIGEAVAKACPSDISAKPAFVILKERGFRLIKVSRADIDAFGGPMPRATATGVKKKQWKMSGKWAIPKKQEASGSSDDTWKAIGMKDELKIAQGNYQLYCSACHGINGDGKGDLADALGVLPRNHTDGKYMSKRTDEQLFRTVSEGGKVTGFDETMPSHKTVIIEKEIRGLVKYLRKLCNCKYKEK